MTSRIFGSSPNKSSQNESGESPTKKSGSTKDKEDVRKHVGPSALKTDTRMEQFLDKLRERGIPPTDGDGVKALYRELYMRREQAEKKQPRPEDVRQARRSRNEEPSASTTRPVREARPKPQTAAQEQAAQSSWFAEISEGISQFFAPTKPLSESTPLVAPADLPTHGRGVIAFEEDDVNTAESLLSSPQATADEPTKWAAHLASTNLQYGSPQFEEFKSFCETTLQIAKHAKDGGEHEIAAKTVECVVSSLCAAGKTANIEVCLELLELTHRLESNRDGAPLAFTKAADELMVNVQKLLDGFRRPPPGECQRKDLLADLLMADKILSGVCANYPWPCSNLEQTVTDNQMRVLRAGMTHLTPDQLETLFEAVNNKALTREVLQNKLFVPSLLLQPKWSHVNLDLRGAGAAAGSVFVQDFKIATQFLNQRGELLGHTETVDPLVQSYLALGGRGKHVVLKQLGMDPLFSALFTNQPNNAQLNAVSRAIEAFRKNPDGEYKGPMNVPLFGAMTKEIERIQKEHAKRPDLQIEAVTLVINREIENFFAALGTAPEDPSEELLKEREGTSQAIATVLSLVPDDVLSRTISSVPIWAARWIRRWFDTDNEVTVCLDRRLSDTAN